MGAISALLPGLSAKEMVPIILLPVVGTTLLVAIFFLLRRVDVEDRGDGFDRGEGGGEGGPGPDDSPGPLDVPNPPLGQIRASRARASARS